MMPEISCWHCTILTLPNDKTLGEFKIKAFGGDKLLFVLGKVENIVGK